jgi:hypothetical protein
MSVIFAASDDVATRIAHDKIGFRIVLRGGYFESFEHVWRRSDLAEIRVGGGSGRHCSRS